MAQRKSHDIDRVLRPRVCDIDYDDQGNDSEDYVEDRECSETKVSCSEENFPNEA